MKNIFFLFPFIFFVGLKQTYNQDRKTDRYYLYDNCNECFFSYSKDTASRITSDKKYITLKIKDSTGSAWFCVKAKNSFREVLWTTEGYYSANQIKYDTTINMVVYGGYGKIKKRTFYYKPFRDSVWNYYDSKGILFKTEVYDKGKLIDIRIN